MSQLPPDQPAPPTSPSAPPPAAPAPSRPPLDYGALPQPFDWVDFFTFRTMIAIPVIMILFWIGVFVTIVGGIVTLFSGGMRGVCSGLATIILGPFIVRLYCEFLIVVFRINETLTEVHKTLLNRMKL